MRTKLLIAILLTFIANVSKAQNQEVLTNQSVMNMIKKGLPTSIIISKIKSAKNKFDVSTDTLIKLKENNMPDDVMNAIVEVSEGASRHVQEVDLNDPLNPHESGVYYLKSIGDMVQLVPLDPSICSQSKSGGQLLQAFTYGLAKVKQAVTLDGGKSQVQFDDTKPVFYFYFDATKNSLGQSNNWWFSSATSPNEFLLVKLLPKLKTREVEIGSYNALGSSNGVADKNKEAFRYEKIANGIYKVYFEQPLSGEYCFMYAGTVPQGFTAINKVYDFGVKGESTDSPSKPRRNRATYMH